MSGDDSSIDKIVLDDLTPKQRAKEFKSVQKALHSKDFAVRLTALVKLSGDARYITEGNCLPSFFESLAPTKKLLDYLVPALTWFAQTLQAQAHLSISDHPIIKTLLEIIRNHHVVMKQQSQSVPVPEEEEKSPKEPVSSFALHFIHSLLLSVHFREELKKPKVKVSKKKDSNLPPPPMPTENPVYGQIRFLASKCLYYLFLPVHTTKDTATTWFEKQGQEQRQRVLHCVSDKTETFGDDSSVAFKAQELVIRHIPELLVSVHDAAFQHYQDYLATRSSTEPSTEVSPVFNNTNNVPSSVQSYQNAYYCWKVLAVVIRHVDHRAVVAVTASNNNSNIQDSEEENGNVLPESALVEEQEMNILWSKIVSKTENHKLLCDLIKDKHLGLSVMSYIMALTESLVLEERAWHVFSEDNASISLLATLVKLFHETGNRIKDYETSYQQHRVQHQQDLAAAAAVAADPKAAAKAAPPKKEDPKKGKAGAKEEVKPIVETKDTSVTLTCDTIDMISYPEFQPQTLYQQSSSSSSLSNHSNGNTVTEALAPATPLSVTSMARKDSLALYYLARIFLRLVRRGDTQLLLFEVIEDTLSHENDEKKNEKNKKLLEELQKHENKALHYIATIVQTIQAFLLSEVVSLMMYFPANIRHFDAPSDTNKLYKWFEEEDNLQDIHVVSLLLIQSLSVLRYPDYGDDDKYLLQKVRIFLVQHTEVHITVQKYLLASRKFYGVNLMRYDLLHVHKIDQKHHNDNDIHPHRGEEMVFEHHVSGHIPLQLRTEEVKGTPVDVPPMNDEYSIRLKNLFVARKKAERVILDLLSFSSAPYFTVYPSTVDSNNSAINVKNHEERYVKPMTGLLCGPEKANNYNTDIGSSDSSVNHIRRLRRLSSHPAYVSPATLFHLNQPSTTTDQRYSYLFFHDDWTQVGPFHAIHDFENVAFAATVPSEDTPANVNTATTAAAKDTTGKDKKSKTNEKKEAISSSNATVDMPSLAQLPSVALVRHWLEMMFQPVQEYHQLLVTASNSTTTDTTSNNTASTSNKAHVDFDLANRALRMMHLLLISLPKTICDRIVQKQELSNYFVSTLGNYLDILLSYYLTQLEQHQQHVNANNNSHLGKKKVSAKSMNILLEEGDPSIEEGIYDLFALLEALLHTSAESIKQFALSNNKYHKERFQKIQHLLYISGPVLLATLHSNNTQQGLTDRVLNKAQQYQRWKRMQERYVTVRDPRESALHSCVGFISSEAEIRHKTMTTQQRSTPRHHAHVQKRDANKPHYNFDVQNHCSLVADYAAYGLQHAHYVQHFVRDCGSVTEHRGRNVHATHVYHLRGLIWDVLGLLVSSDRKFRTVNTSLFSMMNGDKNATNNAGDNNANITCIVPSILSQETIANHNLNPANPVQSIINQSVVSECEAIATEIVMQFVDLALQMSIVSSSLCSANSNASHSQSFVSADWYVSPEDGVQVRSLASSIAVKSPPLSSTAPKHLNSETISGSWTEKDEDSARNDVIAASLRFLQEMGGMTVQGITAALEGVVQTMKNNPYLSYVQDITDSDSTASQNKESLTMIGHLILSLSRQSAGAVAVSETLSEYFSLPWSETGRVRYFDELFPEQITAEKLFQPTFLLSQPRLWPWMCLVFPLLANLSNPEVPVSLTEQCILTLQQCTQHHLSLFFPPQLQTYASLIPDAVAGMFVYLGGAHLLSGHLGTFGLLSEKTKLSLTSNKTMLGEQSFYLYLLSRGITREQYWTNYHQQIRVQKQLEEEANKVNIDPKTGKPINKKDDKKPPPKKDEKKKDNKDNANSNAVKESLVADIMFNHDEFSAEYYTATDNNNVVHVDPNHGPDARVWSLLLNRRAHVPQLLTKSSPLLHTLILGQVGSFGENATQCSPDNNSRDQHNNLLFSLSSSSSVAVHFISHLGGYISINDRDNSENGCTPLMYALLLQDIPCIEALLTFEGTQKDVCDVNARDAQGHPAMFYAFFGLQYKTQCTQSPSLHHPYYASANYAFKQQQQEKHQEKRVNKVKHQPKQHFYFLYNTNSSHNSQEIVQEKEESEDEDMFHSLKMANYRSHALLKPQLHLYDALYSSNSTKNSGICSATYHNHWSIYHLLGHCSLQTLQTFFCHPSVTTTLYKESENAQIRHHLHVFARSLRSKGFSFPTDTNNATDLHNDCDGQTLLLALLGATTVQLNLAGYTVQIQHEAYHLQDDRFALLTPHNGLRTYHRRHHASISRRNSKANVHHREDFLCEDISENNTFGSNNPSSNNAINGAHSNNVQHLSAEEEHVARTHILQLIQELTSHLRVKLHPEVEFKDSENTNLNARKTQHWHAIDANQCDAQGISPLCVAVCRGDLSLTTYLVKELGVEVNMIDKQGFHVLHHLVAVAPHAFYHFYYHHSNAKNNDNTNATEENQKKEHLMLYYSPANIETQTMTEWQKDVAILTLDIFDLLVAHAENRPLVPFAFDFLENSVNNSNNHVNGIDTSLLSLEKQLEQMLLSAFTPLQPSSSSSLSESKQTSSSSSFQPGKRLSKAEVLTLTRQQFFENHSFQATNEYNLLFLSLAGPALLTTLFAQNNVTQMSSFVGVSYEDHCTVSPAILCHTTQHGYKTHYLYDDLLPSRYECRVYNGDISALGHTSHRHASIQREKYVRLMCFLHLWQRLEELVVVKASYAGENIALKRLGVENPYLKELLVQEVTNHAIYDDGTNDTGNDGVRSSLRGVNIVHCLAIACASQSIAMPLTPKQVRCKRLEYFVHPEAAVTQRLMRALTQWCVTDIITNYNDNNSDDNSDNLWIYFVRSVAPVHLLQANWDRRLTHYHLTHFPSVFSTANDNNMAENKVHGWSSLSLSIVQNNIDLVDLFYALLTENVSVDRTRHLLSTLQPVVLMALIPAVLTTGDLLHPEMTSLFVDLASHKNQKDIAKELLQSDIIYVYNNTNISNSKVYFKAWHLAAEHGQVSLLASLLDCPKIDVNTPIYAHGNDTDVATNKIAVDTVVSQVMKLSKSIELLSQRMMKKATFFSTSPRNNNAYNSASNSNSNNSVSEYYDNQRFRLWRMLEGVKDRLDFTVRYAPSYINNANANNTVNVVEEVLFLCDSVSWEAPLHWLMELVAMRKNDVLNALLAPVPSHLASKYNKNANNSTSTTNKAIYEVILAGDRKMIRTYVQDLLHDVLQLQEEEDTSAVQETEVKDKETKEESPSVYVEDAGDERE